MSLCQITYYAKYACVTIIHALEIHICKLMTYIFFQEWELSHQGHTNNLTLTHRWLLDVSQQYCC